MPTYDFAKFPQKLHEIERIWTPGGVPRAPLRSATVQGQHRRIEMCVNVYNIAKGCLADWHLNLITQKGMYDEELASFHRGVQVEVMTQEYLDKTSKPLRQKAFELRAIII